MRKETLYKTVLLFTICFLLSACSKEEQQDGTDDYVYIAQYIALPDKDQYGHEQVQNLKTAGGYLYYLNDESTNSENTQYGIYKLALDGEVKLAKDGKMDLTDSELVMGMSDLIKYGADDEFPMDNPYIRAYDVDKEQGVYLFICNRVIGKEQEGGILVKKTAGGEDDFTLLLPQATVGYGDILAVNEEYIALLLSDGVICLIDKSGNIIGSIPVESDLRDFGYEWKEQLLPGEEGKIYYSIDDSYIEWKREVYEILADEQKLKKVDSLSRQYSSANYFVLYGSTQGLIYAESKDYQGSGTIYLYNGKEDSLVELLNWVDSNMNEFTMMDDILWVDEDTIAAYCILGHGAEKGLYLLRKTAVRDLPQKEEVVIACNYPFAGLMNSVAGFNRDNDTYHITVKIYDGDGWLERFDSSLVSSNPPDLIDLSFMDIEKYAQKRALADLAPYFDKSDVLNREDYLENVLEGYTYNGSLVCIPKQFYFYEVLGRASQIDSSKEWDMKTVMELTEQYPGLRLRNRGDISTYYILEHFIDWEKGTCSLDGEEFQEFVRWMVQYENNDDLWHDAGDDSFPDDILLGYFRVGNICDYIFNLARMGEEAVAVGFPTGDGKGMCRAFVSDALCMTMDSQHKEGAWAFLEYYLMREDTDGGMEMTNSFSTRRDQILSVLQEASTIRQKVDEYGNAIFYMDGAPVLEKKFTYSVNRETFTCYYITKEQADELLEMIESLDFKPLSGSKEEAISIIRDEVMDYQSGNKSLGEVTDVIQRRVALLLSETL